jgi:WD40 repeat protein
MAVLPEYKLRLLRTENETGSAVTALDISDDATAALAMDNGSIWIFNLDQNVAGYKLGGHGKAVWSLASRGNSLLSGCAAGSITLWDPTQRFKNPSSQPAC